MKSSAGEDDARSFIVSAIFNRSLTLLVEGQARRAGSALVAVPDDDAEQEFLRLAEEKQMDELLDDEGLRTELQGWTWGRLSLEKDTRLLWRWWIWK